MVFSILILDLFLMFWHKGIRFINSLIKVFRQMINTQIRRIIGYVARAASIAAIAGLTLFAAQAVAGETEVAALSSFHATEGSIRAASTIRAARAPRGLELEALADRLRATDGIGIFRKLAIKNKVDELARGFGYYHQGHRMADLGELRARFEALRSTIVMALKSGDPALAKDVAQSGQSLWLAFCDPVLFAKGIGREIVAQNEMAKVDIGQ